MQNLGECVSDTLASLHMSDSWLVVKSVSGIHPEILLSRSLGWQIEVVQQPVERLSHKQIQKLSQIKTDESADKDTEIIGVEVIER